MINRGYLNNKNIIQTKKLRWIIFIITLVSILPIYIFFIYPGLDTSWVYAFNKFGLSHYKFGTDIVMNWGPLAFVCFPINQGNNIIISILFWILIYIFQIMLLYSICFKDQNLNKQISNWKLTFALILFVIPMRTFETSIVTNGVVNYHFQPTIPEYNLNMTVILAISCYFWGKRKRMYATIISVITIAIAFIKFSAVLFVISSILTLILIAYIFRSSDKELFKNLVWFLLIPVGFILTYLVYNPSIKALIDYIIIAKEESGGYSAAMSLIMANESLLWVAIITMACIIFMLILSKFDKKTMIFLLLFLGPYFVMFKHAYVRADHYLKFFEHFLELFAIFLMFWDLELLYKNIKNHRIFYVLTFSIIVLIMLLPNIYIIEKSSDSIFGKVADRFYEKYISSFSRINNYKVGDEKLSSQILNIIGNSTVTIYPYEISYALYNNLNYIPMPCLQAYTMYTPYLDEKNSEFFAKTNAPEYIIFNLSTIDRRIPLIEAPVTWNEISKRYEVVTNDNNNLLLKKKKIISNKEVIKISEFKANKIDSIAIPKEDSIVLMSIKSKFNTKGKFANTFFRIPEVTMQITYENGMVITGRVLLDNLSNVFIINKLPYDFNGVTDYLNNYSYRENVVSIRLSGDGLSYYDCNFDVTFYKYN